MPSLFKRNHVYYVAYYEDGTQRWRSTGQRSKPAALKELFAFEQRQKPQSPRITLQAFIKDFLGYADVTYARRTITIYARALRQLATFIGDVPLTSITAKDIDLFRMQRMKELAGKCEH